MLFRPFLLAFVTVALMASHGARGQEEAGARTNDRGSASLRIAPTDHPPLPTDLAGYWLLPADTRPSRSALQLASGVGLIGAGKYEESLSIIDPHALADTPLFPYAQLYRAAALIALDRLTEADALLRDGAEAELRGAMAEVLPMKAAEVALAIDDPERALEILDDLSGDKLLNPEAVWLEVGHAAEQAGKVNRALDAYRKLYYEHPLSAQAAEADERIAVLQTADRIPPDRYRLELDRAQMLFDARRWAQARAGFEPLAAVAQGAERTLVAVRIAQCDYYLGRYRPSRDALRPHLDGPLGAEAHYFYASAVRALGDRSGYEKLARQLVEDHPDSPWAAEVLDGLASHLITTDRDGDADGIFRELLRQFPGHVHSERAAWKVGWRAYRDGQYREAAETFERAAATFRRADYRPSWLYWSARARTELREPDAAARLYAITVADYQNSYYGRLAVKAAGTAFDIVPPAAATSLRSEDGQIPTGGLIRELLALGLYDDALREVRYAQRVWGDSPRLQATVALIRHNQGLALSAQERFSALRGAINTMRRAYPQFMAAGGEHLPPEILRIIFPLDYWTLITKYADAHDLDPYLLAALMAQESTFTAEIRSSANAIGLMQLIPATGRRMASRLGVRNFSTRLLTQPEVNVRLGTRYFKDLITQFGEEHFALAGYNAGEHRVERWRAERGPLPADEFIDDIPFPETQLYVKRILGTAEDYRRLYGGGLLDPNLPLAASAAIGPPSIAASSLIGR